MSWFSFAREALYRCKLFRPLELPAFTLSVGNISLGGTGKSPIVSQLAKHFLARSIPTALLSRGYGRKSREGIVLPPNAPLPAPTSIGDEPWMIREANPGLALAVHPRRGDLAFARWEDLGAPKLALLDDAFQHWRVARDFDIVALDATEPLEQRTLPFGRLREGLKALRRADLVVLTRTNEADPEKLPAIREKIAFLLGKDRTLPPWKRSRYSFDNPTLLECSYELQEFRDARTKEVVPRETLCAGILLSGIAKPQSFERLLRGQGILPKEKIVRGDHEAWSPAIENAVLAALAREPGSPILLTQKDWARWREPLERLKVKAAYAEVALRFSPESERKLGPILEKISSCITSA